MNLTQKNQVKLITITQQSALKVKKWTSYAIITEINRGDE